MHLRDSRLIILSTTDFTRHGCLDGVAMDICTIYWLIQCQIPMGVVHGICIGGAVAVVLIFLYLMFFAPKRAMADGYLTQIKHKAYRLMHTENPKPKDVTRTSSALAVFPEDEVASEFKRRLAGVPPQRRARQLTVPKDFPFYYDPLALPRIYYGG